MTTVKIALDDFQLANKADGLAPKTLEWYRRLLDDTPNSLTRWLFVQSIVHLSDVTTGKLREYIVSLRDAKHARTGEPLSDDTVNDYIRALHRFFAFCSAEYGVGNPMSRIAYPKSKSVHPKAIELDDFRRMYAICGVDAKGDRDRALLAFLIDTGVRAGGIVTLKREHLNMDARKAVVTEKGSKPRVVVFTSKTCELLAIWLAHPALVPNVFYNLLRGKPLTVNGLRQALARIARAAKVSGRVNPHSFRHAFAREYILAGGDLATLAKLMGHNDTSTTTGYYTLFTEGEIAEKHEQFSPMSKLFPSTSNS